MRPLYYRLDPITHEVIPIEGEDAVLQWAAEQEIMDRCVDRTLVFSNVLVSTVFLGLDHSFSDNDPPLIFETMVFGGPLDGDQIRYSTWEQAQSGHDFMVSKVRAAHTPWNRIKTTYQRLYQHVYYNVYYRLRAARDAITEELQWIRS